MRVLVFHTVSDGVIEAAALVGENVGDSSLESDSVGNSGVALFERLLSSVNDLDSVRELVMV